MQAADYNLDEIRNAKVRDDWYSRVSTRIMTAAVETEMWWIVDLVDVYYDAVFTQATEISCLFATSVPQVMYEDGGRCQLTFNDASGLVRAWLGDGGTFYTRIEAGDLSASLFTVDRNEAPSNIRQLILASGRKSEFCEDVGNVIGNWLPRHNHDYTSPLVFGVMAALSHLESEGFVCLSDLEQVDYSSDQLELLLARPTEVLRVTIDLEAFTTAYNRIVAQIEALSTPSPQSLLEAANDDEMTLEATPV